MIKVGDGVHVLAFPEIVVTVQYSIYVLLYVQLLITFFL